MAFALALELAFKTNFDTVAIAFDNSAPVSMGPERTEMGRNVNWGVLGGVGDVAIEDDILYKQSVLYKREKSGGCGCLRV